MCKDNDIPPTFAIYQLAFWVKRKNTQDNGDKGPMSSSSKTSCTYLSILAMFGSIEWIQGFVRFRKAHCDGIPEVLESFLASFSDLD